MINVLIAYDSIFIGIFLRAASSLSFNKEKSDKSYPSVSAFSIKFLNNKLYIYIKKY